MTEERTLQGRQIVVGVTGSIAAVEMVRAIHALRRKGAEVQVVMSAAACGIVAPDALAYASNRPVITRITGLVEHVSYCGDGGSADLLLIAPCTANTIGKIACGIDDTPVTTFATTALGSNMPVVIVPAMHHSMYRHSGVVENIRRLKGWGIIIIEPVIDEGKAKIAGTEEIVLFCERALLSSELAGKRVLVTSGPCREPLDDVRVLTTRSSGQMGREIALEAFRRGAEVTVVHNDTFPCITNIHAETAKEMHDAVIRTLKKNGADIYISAAAISDFAPVRHKGKIRSGANVSIDLVPLPKILDDVMKKFKPLTVAFKLGDDAESRADEILKKGAALVVANTPETMGTRTGEYTIHSKEGRTTVKGPKQVTAAAIWDAIVSVMSRSS